MTLRNLKVHTPDDGILTMGDDPNSIPPAAPASVDRFKGALLGCALGDAVGAWAERRPAIEAKKFAEEIVREFQFSKVGTHHRGMRFGQYTDDTQLSRELVLSLIDEHKFVPEDFADRIARIFARDEVVGYGGATQQAAVRLIEGVPWDAAGTPPPRAGNGAAMRAGPIGLFFYHDVQACVSAARDQAIITHKAEASVAGAVAMALATAMASTASKATTGPHEPGWWTWLAHHVQVGGYETFAREMRELVKLVFDGRKTGTWKPASDKEFAAAAEYVLNGDDESWEGVSPYARSSVLWAFYCVMAAPFDIWKAIETAIAIGGDSDTIAAMTATVVGAHVGLSSFPEKVHEEVAPLIHDVKSERYTWDALGELAELLHEVVLKGYAERVQEWENER